MLAYHKSHTVGYEAVIPRLVDPTIQPSSNEEVLANVNVYLPDKLAGPNYERHMQASAIIRMLVIAAAGNITDVNAASAVLELEDLQHGFIIQEHRAVLSQTAANRVGRIVATQWMLLREMPPIKPGEGNINPYFATSLEKLLPQLDPNTPRPDY